MQLLLIATCFTLWLHLSWGHSCTCNPSNCVEPTCRGGLVRDPCGCCRICAKQEHEECGGMFDLNGLCDKNLTCVIQATNGAVLTENKPGKCKPTNQLTSTDKCYEVTYNGCNLVDRECECSQQVACSNPYQFQSLEACFNYRRSLEGTRKECADVRCSIPQSKSCPDDSLLIEGYTPPDQCCPIPSRCECRANLCAYNLCPPKHRRALVKSGSNNPGSCCDEYQCVRQESEEDCSEVECSIASLSSISCPSGSVAIRNPFSSSACCPGEPICRCDQQLCPSPPTCADGLRLKIAYRGNQRPGSCCDEYVCSADRVFVGCLVNNTRYEHGTFYQLDKCQYCECVKGLSQCGPPPCPQITCSNIIFDEDEDCCPRCLHQDGGSPHDPNPPCVTEDGSTYAFGETWSIDECTHCTCAEGGESDCRAAFCQEPSTVPDTPSCLFLAQCTLKDKDCRYGFHYNNKPCRTCQCRSGILGCRPLTDCLITCPLGYVVDQSGCDTCQCRQRKCKELPESCEKQCPYGFKQNKKNCERCKCRSCPSVSACKKKCSLGLAENKYGCPICKCKVDSGDQHSIPELAHMCTDPITGSRYDDGETWSGDQCHMCLCRGGDVVCDVIQCPVLSCKTKIMKDGDCCPTCQDTDSQAHHLLSCRSPGGDRFVEGEIWNYDKCTTCSCHAGHIMCTSSFCPPILCDNPVYDENLCCPKCLSEPRSNLSSKSCRAGNGSVYENGDEFKTGPCTSCVCRDGDVKCFDENCPAMTSCANPVVKRGQCCPKCLGESPSQRSCTTSDGVRMHAEEWNKTSNGCTTCMCVDGSVTCKEPDCRPISRGCRRLYRRPGECCQVCVLMDENLNPSVPSYPNSASADQTLPIALSIIFIFIFLFLVFILSLYIFKRWYPEKFHSLRFRIRKRHKSEMRYTAGSEENQMTIRSESSEKIEVRSGSVGGGSSGTARSDMTNLSSLLDEKLTK